MLINNKKNNYNNNILWGQNGYLRVLRDVD